MELPERGGSSLPPKDEGNWFHEDKTTHTPAEIIAPGDPDNDDAQVVLSYRVQDHNHGETKFLIRVWLEWKSRGGFRPETPYQHKGVSSLEWWKVNV